MAALSSIKSYIKVHTPPKLWAFLHEKRQTLRRAVYLFNRSTRRSIVDPILERWFLFKLRTSRKKQIAQYFANTPLRKLQLGAGINCLPDWLNSEAFVPSSFKLSITTDKNYIYLDVCQPFPMEDNSVDYIFHEHVIEHLNYHQGHFMLKECFRVLKPGGRVRIATPDLQFFVGLYGSGINAEQRLFLKEYVRFNSKVWSHDLNHVRNNEAVFVLNHNFRAWGHQFIYDYATLADALEITGFVETERQAPHKSRDIHLRNLEYRKEIVGILDALIIEARKPLSPSV